MNSQDFNLMKPAYSISEALEILPFGRTTLYAEIKQGKLIATKIGDKTILLAPNLVAYLAALPSMPHRCASHTATDDGGSNASSR